MSDGVTLRLHPDGHWMPNTPGRWRCYPWKGDKQVVEVYEFKGGLNVRFRDGTEQSVREAEPAEWGWVPPKGPTEVTP